MKMHPAEIAQEIRNFPFFKELDETVILQIATMMENVSFPAGSYLLKEKEKNSRLFFLRKGHIDLILADEIIASYFTAGEFVGEMSVVSGKPSTINIRASEPTECFVLDSENFKLIQPKHRDQFFSYLYKLYALILCDRLEKASEKARFFEMAHRELHQAQMNLSGNHNKHALLIQKDKKQLVLTKMGLGGTGITMDVAETAEEGWQKALGFKYDIVICDENSVGIINKLREQKYPTKFILLLSKNVEENIGILSQIGNIEYVITRDPDDRQMTVRTVLIALSKIITGDFFGMEKYLSWGVDLQSRLVKGSAERMDLKEELVSYLKKSGVRSSILDRVFSVTEELLMNAVYDAPHDRSGVALFNHISRKENIVLDTHLQSQLRYGTDGAMVGISVTDPFGALSRDIIIKYLKSCYEGKAGIYNTDKGGAGRGLHQIIENADLTIFNVRHGERTEVISLFSLESTRRSAYPSFHYFFQE